METKDLSNMEIWKYRNKERKKRLITLLPYCFIILLLYYFITSVYAGIGTTSANFLKLPQGNRAVAMGNSFVAFAEGPVSMYWNPAGLANGVFNEGRMVYNDWIQGVINGYAAYRHNLKAGGFALAVTYLNSGKMVKRGSGREDSGATYSLENVGIGIGRGVKINNNFNAGVSINFIYESIDGNSINGLAGGLGAQYHKKINEHYLNAGVSIMNLGTQMGYQDKFPLPAVIRLGVGDELLAGRLRGSAEIDYYIVESKVNGGLGIELRATPFLDLRCGYKFGYRDISLPYGLTAGFEIKYVESVEYLFDYSITTIGDLGYINRIGFGIRF